MTIKLSAETLAALGNPKDPKLAADAFRATVDAADEARKACEASVETFNAAVEKFEAATKNYAAAAEKFDADAKEKADKLAALVADSDSVAAVAEAAASTVAGKALTAAGANPSTDAAGPDAKTTDATEQPGSNSENKLAEALEAKDYVAAYPLSDAAQAEFPTAGAFAAYMRQADAGRVDPFKAD
jgi:ABC-type transporter Mla subunit MlaD